VKPRQEDGTRLRLWNILSTPFGEEEMLKLSLECALDFRDCCNLFFDERMEKTQLTNLREGL
jgi:hypothetical protein